MIDQHGTWYILVHHTKYEHLPTFSYGLHYDVVFRGIEPDVIRRGVVLEAKSLNQERKEIIDHCGAGHGQHFHDLVILVVEVEFQRTLKVKPLQTPGCNEQLLTATFKQLS